MNFTHKNTTTTKVVYVVFTLFFTFLISACSTPDITGRVRSATISAEIEKERLAQQLEITNKQIQIQQEQMYINKQLEQDKLNAQLQINTQNTQNELAIATINQATQVSVANRNVIISFLSNTTYIIIFSIISLTLIVLLFLWNPVRKDGVSVIDDKLKYVSLLKQYAKNNDAKLEVANNDTYAITFPDGNRKIYTYK